MLFFPGAAIVSWVTEVTDDMFGVAASAPRLDANRLPALPADGDREALRFLLVVRQEITVACIAQTNRLRALLLTGDDTDRRSARGALTGAALAALAAVHYLLTPVVTMSSAAPRSAAWRSRSAKPARSSQTTTPSC